MQAGVHMVDLALIQEITLKVEDEPGTAQAGRRSAMIDTRCRAGDVSIESHLVRPRPNLPPKFFRGGLKFVVDVQYIERSFSIGRTSFEVYRSTVASSSLPASHFSNQETWEAT